LEFLLDLKIKINIVVHCIGHRTNLAVVQAPSTKACDAMSYKDDDLMNCLVAHFKRSSKIMLFAKKFRGVT